VDDNPPVGELHGGHPDQPPEKPDAPKPSGDRPRPTEPPTGDNNDPKAIWRTIRQSDHPAFATPGGRPPPHVDVRYVTDPHTDTAPSAARPYRTSRDRPPSPASDPPDGPAHQAPDLIPPRGDALLESDAPDASILSRLRKQALDKESLENEIDVVQESGNTLDDAISKPTGPTYAQVAARSGPSMFETPTHGVNLGDTGATIVVAGILIGEGTRLAYHKLLEARETRHARER
jgi:hypothetical protein